MSHPFDQEVICPSVCARGLVRVCELAEGVGRGRERARGGKERVQRGPLQEPELRGGGGEAECPFRVWWIDGWMDGWLGRLPSSP